MKTDNFKRFMTFSRGERIAITTIVSVIVIILIIKHLIVLNPPKRTYFVHDLDSIIERRNAVMDSIRVADSIEKVKASTSFRAQRSGVETRAKREHSPQVNKSSTKHVAKPRNSNQDSVGRGCQA